MLQLYRDWFTYFLVIFYFILSILKLHRLGLKISCVHYHISNVPALNMKLFSLFSNTRKYSVLVQACTLIKPTSSIGLTFTEPDIISDVYLSSLLWSTIGLPLLQQFTLVYHRSTFIAAVYFGLP